VRDKMAVNSPDKSIKVSVSHEDNRVKIDMRKGNQPVITLDANGLKFEEEGFDFTRDLTVQSVKNTFD
jgi:hypothetical protein